MNYRFTSTGVEPLLHISLRGVFALVSLLAGCDSSSERSKQSTATYQASSDYVNKSGDGVDLATSNYLIAARQKSRATLTSVFSTPPNVPIN